MKNVIQFICMSLGIFVLMGAGDASSQDWPQWRGSNRDGKAAGFISLQEWPTELKQVWKTTVGFGDASPSLVGDKLYIFSRLGDEEMLLCLDANSGEEIWRDVYKAGEVTGAARSHPGPRSTPTVAGDKIVALGVCGVLSCWDASSKKLLWRKDPFPNVVPRFFTSMSPIVVDGMAIAHLGGAGNGALIAYDLTTGEEKWRWSEEGPDYASPVLMTVEGVRQIVTLTEKSVVGIGADNGKLLWKIPFEPQRRAYNSATPIIDGQKVIYTGSGRGASAVRIEKQGDDFSVQPIWSNPELAPQFNTPVLKDGFLFGITDNNRFYCINALNGETAWADSNTNGRGGFGSIIDVGSNLLALLSNADLSAYKPNTEKFEELSRIKVAETETYAHPIVSGKRIFIKDAETVTLFSLD
ncbi:MAG: PQQ-like beta-propeller repeat protein [Candidatus Omnitrophica bacterium]|nr:PQQ-like beta-propeller repeat protein [Candidatus Omnitrophota bacterium]